MAAIGALAAAVLAAVVLMGGSVRFNDWPTPPRGGESKARAPQQLRRVSPSAVAGLVAAKPSGPRAGERRSETALAVPHARRLVPPSAGPGEIAQRLTPAREPGRGRSAPQPSPAPRATPTPEPQPAPPPPPPPVAVVELPPPLSGPIARAAPTVPTAGGEPDQQPASEPDRESQPIAPATPGDMVEPPGLLPPVFPPPPDEPVARGDDGHGKKHKRTRRQKHPHGHRHGPKHGHRHGRGRGPRGGNGPARARGHHRGRHVGWTQGRHVGQTGGRHLGWTHGRHLGWSRGRHIGSRRGRHLGWTPHGRHATPGWQGRRGRRGSRRRRRLGD
jgi:hypothetical protein